MCKFVTAFKATSTASVVTQADRDDAKLRQLTNSYRQLKNVRGAARYFKLKSMIKEAVEDYRNN
jgi:hypothetical protein